MQLCTFGAMSADLCRLGEMSKVPLLLFAFWLALNGRASADVLVLGVLVTALALLFAYKFCGWSPSRELKYLKAAPQALAFLGLLFISIVKANFSVIAVIFTGKKSPCLRTFRTKLKTRAARVLLANSITLTPGTVTVTLEDDILTVHCLRKDMAESLADSDIERRLLRIEEKIHAERV